MFLHHIHEPARFVPIQCDPFCNQAWTTHAPMNSLILFLCNESHPFFPPQEHCSHICLPFLLPYHSLSSSMFIFLVLVRELQRSRINQSIYLFIERFILKNWLMQLWRLRSLTICYLQAGSPASRVSQWSSSSTSPKSWEPRESMVWVLVQVWRSKNREHWWCKYQTKSRRKLMSQFSQTERTNSPFLQPFVLFRLCTG